MEMPDVEAAQAAVVSQSHSTTMQAKENEMIKQEGEQIVNMVDHSAPAGGQVNMIA